MTAVELAARAYDEYTVVALRGELDYVCAAATEAALTMLIAQRQLLIVDLSALDFIDCCALSVLRRVQALARLADSDLVLAAPQPLPLRLLTLTGGGELFFTYPSVQAAVAGTGQALTRPG